MNPSRMASAMTPHEVERALFETRRRIEANMERLARSSAASMDVRPYFTELLQLAAESVSGRGGAVWLREGGKIGMAASLEYDSSEAVPGSRQEHDIAQLVTQCLEKNSTLIVLPGQGEPSPEQTEPTNSAPYPFFYVPILLEGTPLGVLQLWLQQPGDPEHYKDFAAFLGTVASHASTYLHHRHAARARTLAASWQLQARFHQDLVSCHNTQEVLEVSAHHMADLAGAELGFACRHTSKGWKLVAASNADKVIPASSQALLLSAAVEALPKEKIIAVDRDHEKTPEVIREALEQCGARVLVGGFAFESEGTAPRLFLGALRQSPLPPPPEALQSVSSAATSVARVFHEKELREALPLSTLFHAIARLRLFWRTHPRRLLGTVGGSTALLLLILCIPWPYKISADCTVLPAHRLSAVAGTDGKLLQVLVGEGDTVTNGQILARLDDRDLRAQLAGTEETRQRWAVEEANAQSAANDAERKVAELNGLREEENIKLLTYRLHRTEITSPMSGVILTRELRNLEGENMETGKVLCEVADPGAYLLELQIRQQDLGEVQHALSADTPLRIDFILHSHPGNRLHAEVRGLTALAPAAELGLKGSYFILRTQFPGGELAIQDLKTGYTGKAKINLGHRALWRVLFTPFLNYLHVEWDL